MHTIARWLGIGLVLGVMACAGHARAATDAPVASLADGFDASVRRDVETLRAATNKYHELAAAETAGYPTAMPKCIADSTMGGMGYHLIDRKAMDDKLEIEHPEMLIYATDGEAKPELVAVDASCPSRAPCEREATAAVRPEFSATTSTTTGGCTSGMAQECGRPLRRLESRDQVLSSGERHPFVGDGEPERASSTDEGGNGFAGSSGSASLSRWLCEKSLHFGPHELRSLRVGEVRRPWHAKESCVRQRCHPFLDQVHRNGFLLAVHDERGDGQLTQSLAQVPVAVRRHHDPIRDRQAVANARRSTRGQIDEG